MSQSKSQPLSRFSSFLHTDPQSTVLFIQRALLAATMFPHGAQKLLGWFGGYGFQGTMGFFTQQMGLPAPIALAVILGESVGAVLLLLGLGTRLAAFGMTANMVGAVLTTHLGNGFFMNWFGQQTGEGFEYHILALALSIPLMVWGGGRYAADTQLLALAVSEPVSGRLART